jgi:DNA repair exonuclease SbcCD ATPase subunit
MKSSPFDDRTEIIGELYIKLRKALQELETYKELCEEKQKMLEARDQRINDLQKSEPFLMWHTCPECGSGNVQKVGSFRECRVCGLNSHGDDA